MIMSMSQGNIKKFKAALERGMYKFDFQKGKILYYDVISKCWREKRSFKTDKRYRRVNLTYAPGKAFHILEHCAIWLAAGKKIPVGYFSFSMALKSAASSYS
jgi:hypothetical protein